MKRVLWIELYIVVNSENFTVELIFITLVLTGVEVSEKRSPPTRGDYDRFFLIFPDSFVSFPIFSPSPQPMTGR